MTQICFIVRTNPTSEAGTRVHVFKCFVSHVTDIDDVNGRVSTLRLLVALLPDVNRHTLWFLLTFLACVVKHSDDQWDNTGHTVSH